MTHSLPGDVPCIKLGDFGIAKILEHTADLAHTQIGTPFYLSPEICENKSYGAKSDMWSLGCILFELTALSVPFNGRDLLSLVRAITHGPLPRLPGVHSSSIPLNKLVQSLLCRVEGKRFSTSEVLELPFVRSIAHQLDPSIPPPADPPRGSPALPIEIPCQHSPRVEQGAGRAAPASAATPKPSPLRSDRGAAPPPQPPPQPQHGPRVVGLNVPIAERASERAGNSPLRSEPRPAASKPVNMTPGQGRVQHRSPWVMPNGDQVDSSQDVVSPAAATPPPSRYAPLAVPSQDAARQVFLENREAAQRNARKVNHDLGRDASSPPYLAGESPSAAPQSRQSHQPPQFGSPQRALVDFKQNRQEAIRNAHRVNEDLGRNVAPRHMQANFEPAGDRVVQVKQQQAAARALQEMRREEELAQARLEAYQDRKNLALKQQQQQERPQQQQRQSLADLDWKADDHHAHQGSAQEQPPHPTRAGNERFVVLEPKFSRAPSQITDSSASPRRRWEVPDKLVFPVMDTTGGSLPFDVAGAEATRVIPRAAPYQGISSAPQGRLEARDQIREDYLERQAVARRVAQRIEADDREPTSAAPDSTPLLQAAGPNRADAVRASKLQAKLEEEQRYKERIAQARVEAHQDRKNLQKALGELLASEES
eukprot:m.838730 g.838730  ORF g.838730 m.838730 type:complete len:653 (+) comp59500_c0_seq30:635-2593(+)